MHTVLYLYEDSIVPCTCTWYGRRDQAARNVSSHQTTGTALRIFVNGRKKTSVFSRSPTKTLTVAVVVVVHAKYRTQV